MTGKDTNGSHLISDTLWEQIEPLLPPETTESQGDGPGINYRETMEAILYVAYTGCEWRDLPSSLGVSGIVRSLFEEWRDAGLFQRMWRAGILTYDELRTLFWYGRRHMQP